MFNILDNFRKIANDAHANVVEMAHTLAAEFQEEGEGLDDVREDEPSTSSKNEPAGKALAKVKSGASHVIETIDKAASLLPPTDADVIFVDLIATLIRQKNLVDPQLDKWLQMYNQWKVNDDSSKFEELRATSEDLIQSCSNGTISPDTMTDVSLDGPLNGMDEHYQGSDYWKKMAEESKDAVEKMEEELVAANQQIIRLKDVLNARDLQMKSLTQENSDKEVEMLNLKDEFEKQCLIAEDVERKYNELKTQVIEIRQDAEEEIERKEEQIKLLENLKTNNDEVENIKILYNLSEEKLKQLQMEYDGLEKQIIKIKQDAQEEIEKKDEQIKLLENLKIDNDEVENIKVLHGTMKQLQSDHSDLKNQITEMKKEYEQEIANKNKQIKLLEEMQSQGSETAKDLLDSTKELKEFQIKYDKLKIQFDEMKEHYEQELREKEEQIKVFENSKSHIEELENIKVLHDVTKEELRQLQIEFNELQSRITELNELHEQEMSKKDEQMELLEEKLKNDNEELHNVKALYDIIKEDLQQLQIKCDELKTQIVEIRQNAQEELDKKDEQIKLLENSKSHDDEMANIKALHDITKEELKQSRSECDELRNQIIEVQRGAQEELDKKDQEIKLIVKKSYEESENIKITRDLAENDLKQLRIECNDLQGQVAKLSEVDKEEIDGLKRQIDNITDQRNSLMKRCNEQFEELKIKAEEMGYWKQYAKDVNTTSEKFQAELIEAHQKISDFVGEIAVKDAQLMALQESVIEKDRLITQLDTTSKNVSEVSDFKAENEHLIKRNEELVEGMQQIQKHLFEIEQNHEQKLKELATAQESLEVYSKTVADLTKQLELVKKEVVNDSEVMKESFIQQINNMEDKITALSKENETLKRDLHLANADLHASKEANQKYQHHIQMLTAELTAKEAEITDIAAELSTNEHDRKVANSDSSADLEELRKSLVSAFKEIEYINSKNEDLRRNLTETQKELGIQKTSVMNLTQEKTLLTTRFEDLKQNYAQLKTDFERLNNSDRTKNSTEVTELRKKLENIEITLNMMKQAFKKLYYEERDQHQMFSLLVSLLEFDSKTSEVMIQAFDKSKTNNSQHFGPGLLEQFDKFVDKEISVSKIQLSPIPQPAFAIPIDEPLERPEISEDLKDILQGKQ